MFLDGWIATFCATKGGLGRRVPRCTQYTPPINDYYTKLSLKLNWYNGH